MDRHADVVELWWNQRVPERVEDSERSGNLEREKGARSCPPFRTPNNLQSHPGGTGLGQRANSHLIGPVLYRMLDMNFRAFHTSRSFEKVGSVQRSTRQQRAALTTYTTTFYERGSSFQSACIAL